MVPMTDEHNVITRAFAVVIQRQWKGTPRALGEALGSRSSPAAARARGSRVLAGEIGPVKHWGDLCAALGVTEDRLLAAVARQAKRLRSEQGRVSWP